IVLQGQVGGFVVAGQEPDRARDGVNVAEEVLRLVEIGVVGQIPAENLLLHVRGDGLLYSPRQHPALTVRDGVDQVGIAEPDEAPTAVWRGSVGIGQPRGLWHSGTPGWGDKQT